MVIYFTVSIQSINFYINKIKNKPKNDLTLKVICNKPEKEQGWILTHRPQQTTTINIRSLQVTTKDIAQFFLPEIKKKTKFINIKIFFLEILWVKILYNKKYVIKINEGYFFLTVDPNFI